MKLIDILNNNATEDGFRFRFGGDNSMHIYTEVDGRTDFLCTVPANVIADLDKQYERGSFEWSCALDLMDAYQDINDIWYVLDKSEFEGQPAESDDWI